MFTKSCTILDNSYFESLAETEFKKNESFYRQLASERTKESFEAQFRNYQNAKELDETELTIKDKDIPPESIEQLVQFQINRIMRILKDRAIVEHCYPDYMKKAALEKLLV